MLQVKINFRVNWFQLSLIPNFFVLTTWKTKNFNNYPFTPHECQMALIDFTLSNATRFYSSMSPLKSFWIAMKWTQSIGKVICYKLYSGRLYSLRLKRKIITIIVSMILSDLINVWSPHLPKKTIQSWFDWHLEMWVHASHFILFGSCIIHSQGTE